MSRKKVAATLAAGILLGAGVMSAAEAASPDSLTDLSCTAASGTGTTWNSPRLKKYNACYFGVLEAQNNEILKRLDKLGAGSNPTPSPTPTTSSTPTQTPTATPSPTPTSMPTTVPAGAMCQPGKEQYVFNGQGSAGLGPLYNASAEQWNVGGYNYKSKMGVCDHDAWYVDVTTDNDRKDGAVKAYPSMRGIYWDYSASDGNLPPLSKFPRLDTTFASTDPATCEGCIYNTAFDVWLNGIGNGQANELMIWTHNVKQTPAGNVVAKDVKLAGHTWTFWAGYDNHYLAFVPTDTDYVKSGTFDIKDFTDWLIAQKRIKPDTTLGQISFGVEAVSTNKVTKHWDFTKFTIASN